MQVVRSPHAHATITHIDVEAARTTPGVLGMFTAADLADLGPLPCNVPVASLQPMIVPPRLALAKDRARHVGDPVAFVVAETRDAARNAAEAVVVDYDVLPAVVDPPAALRDGAPQLWDQAPGNLSYRFQKGDAAAVQAAIAGAAHVVELELINNRIVISALEPRGAIGAYDDAHGFHLQFSGAGVHALKSQLADTVFRVPPERVRVSCPDVGGGFGVKNALYPEWVMLLWAARHLGRPVKWISERAEDFVTTAQGRGNVTRARLALDADGNFLALDVSTIGELGAYLSTGGPGSSTNAPANAMGSGYVIPAIFMDVRGAFTNTVPIDAYRGAGKPEVNYMIERLIDAAARRHGFDPIALRRRNLVAQFPYRKALGTVIDCGRFAANIDAAIAAADHAGFAARRDTARAQGKLRGIGVTCFMETARGAPNEGAEIRFDDGRQGGAAGRHAIQRHGPRDHLSADRRRSARPADRDVPLRAGRHRVGTRRQRPWRRAVDAHGRHRAVQGRGRDAGKGRQNRRPPAASLARAGDVRRRPLRRARRSVPRHRPAQRRPRCARPRQCAGGRNPRPGHLCLEPARPDHLPQRLPHRRGRDRSRTPAPSRWNATPRWTISARC